VELGSGAVLEQLSACRLQIHAWCIAATLLIAASLQAHAVVCQRCSYAGVAPCLALVHAGAQVHVGLGVSGGAGGPLCCPEAAHANNGHTCSVATMYRNTYVAATCSMCCCHPPLACTLREWPVPFVATLSGVPCVVVAKYWAVRSVGYRRPTCDWFVG
jgi:hypothetical protein